MTVLPSPPPPSLIFNIPTIYTSKRNCCMPFKRCLLFLAVCLWSRSFAVTQTTTHEPHSPIVLNKTNHVHLVGHIDQTAVRSLHRQLAALAPKRPHYLYISSPGGSVDDGLHLIRMVRAIPNLTCIVEEAYSMAFAILQSCHTRVILDTGSIMQHQIHVPFGGGGLTGDLSRMHAYLRFTLAQSRWLNALQATRVGVSPTWFENRTRDEWWLFGAEAVEQRCVDAVVTYVACARPLLTASTCPLYYYAASATLPLDYTSDTSAESDPCSDTCSESTPCAARARTPGSSRGLGCARRTPCSRSDRACHADGPSTRAAAVWVSYGARTCCT
jgi:ATP-dependent protease ClpP protease subunit